MEESEGRSCSSPSAGMIDDRCPIDYGEPATCCTSSMNLFPLEQSTVTQAAGVIRQAPHETKTKMDD